MAEDAIAKRQPMAVEASKISRRTLLKQVAAVVGLGVASGITIGVPTVLQENRAETPKSTLELLIDKGIKPSSIFLGDVKIIKGNGGAMLNVRSETNTGTRTDITSWLNIEKWNNVNVHDVNEFIWTNALFVEGEDPDNTPGSKGKKGLWLVASVGTNTLGIKNEDLKYISYSSGTGGLVTPINGEFHSITQFDKAGVTINKGEKISSVRIGTVKVSNSP